MADVSGTTDGGQSIGRESSERAGLGLLSRFLGAVFLVLLGGLLMLDTALLRANRNQAKLDAQSAALLTEAFVAAQSELLDRVSNVVSHQSMRNDSAAEAGAVRALLARDGAVRHAWATDSNGLLLLDVDGPAGVAGLTPAQRAGLHTTRASDHTMIAVLPSSGGHRWLWMARPISAMPGGAGGGTAGIVIDGEALTALLNRTRTDSRLALAVIAGSDTAALLGDPSRAERGMSEQPTSVRLPNGGSWRVLSAHALTARSLRWGLWAFGTLGVFFLAYGLIKEQQRALHIADRSLELERL